LPLTNVQQQISIRHRHAADRSRHRRHRHDIQDRDKARTLGRHPSSQQTRPISSSNPDGQSQVFAQIDGYGNV
jgi:hypothetical protein